MEENKFVAFGEILLRLAPDGYLRFAQAEHFNLNYTGAEANMAITLSYMGIPSKMVTKLPDHEIGHSAKRMLNKFGVQTNHLAWGGERMGVYFLERGASQRPSKVIYDRKHSAVSEASPDDFDWEAIFADAAWFHFTGVTVALSKRLEEICRQACIAAKRRGVRISCDLNYRSALWTADEAHESMQPLMPYVDVLITNEDHVDKVLNIRVNGERNQFGHLTEAGYSALLGKLLEKYQFSAVAFSLRETVSASINHWSALLYQGNVLYSSKHYIMQMVDRVGGGDSFASGLIYGYLKGFDPQAALDFATAASCLKHSIEFDFNLSTPEEVLTLMNSNVSGRIIR